MRMAPMRLHPATLLIALDSRCAQSSATATGGSDLVGRDAALGLTGSGVDRPEGQGVARRGGVESAQYLRPVGWLGE